MPNCAVLTCKKRSQVCSKRQGGISFHRFPKDVNIKKKWIEATGRVEWIPRSSCTICSQHFAEKDFMIKPSGKRYLKLGAIPHKKCTIVPFSASSESASNTITQAAFTSDNITKAICSGHTITRAASTTDETTKKNKENIINSSPASNVSSPGNRKLKEIINAQDEIIKRQRMKIKKILAQNRRLKKKINKVEDMLAEVQEKNNLRSEDVSILENVNIKV